MEYNIFYQSLGAVIDEQRHSRDLWRFIAPACPRLLDSNLKCCGFGTDLIRTFMEQFLVPVPPAGYCTACVRRVDKSGYLSGGWFNVINFVSGRSFEPDLAAASQISKFRNAMIGGAAAAGGPGNGVPVNTKLTGTIEKVLHYWKAVGGKKPGTFVR